MDYLDLRQQDAVYVEAIKDGEIIRVPERVAILEDLFILRKINNSPQTTVSLPSQNSSIKSKEPVLRNNSIMNEWKHGKFGNKKNNALQDLIPNFNWEVAKNRKSRNITRVKLAQMINSTEEDVKKIELGELPADDFVLISRIENVFGINLRKHPSSIAQVNLADLQKRNEEKKKEKAPSNLFKDSATVSGNDIEILD
ncbi:MAG: hypothetical protein AABX23_03020 [Nanoarchaeota archaeon]